MLAERLLHHVGFHGSAFSAAQAHEWARGLLDCVRRRFCATRGHDLILHFEPRSPVPSVRRLRLGVSGMDDRQTAILVYEESIRADGRSARTLDRLERRSVEQTVRGEHARVAKQAASTREVERLAGEIGHTSTGLLDQ